MFKDFILECNFSTTNSQGCCASMYVYVIKDCVPQLHMIEQQHSQTLH